MSNMVLILSIAIFLIIFLIGFFFNFIPKHLISFNFYVEFSLNSFNFYLFCFALFFIDFFLFYSSIFV
jgi:hypothetical protein